MRERRLKRGECVTCGYKLFIKTLFKSTPITEDGKVLNGRCLNCKPLNEEEVGMEGIVLTAQVEVASEKDLQRANSVLNQSRSFKAFSANRTTKDVNFANFNPTERCQF